MADGGVAALVANLHRQSKGASSLFSDTLKGGSLPHHFGEVEIGTPFRHSNKKAWKAHFCSVTGNILRVYTLHQKKLFRVLQLEGSDVELGPSARHGYEIHFKAHGAYWLFLRLKTPAKRVEWLFALKRACKFQSWQNAINTVRQAFENNDFMTNVIAASKAAGNTVASALGPTTPAERAQSTHWDDNTFVSIEIADLVSLMRSWRDDVAAQHGLTTLAAEQLLWSSKFVWSRERLIRQLSSALPSQHRAGSAGGGGSKTDTDAELRVILQSAGLIWLSRHTQHCWINPHDPEPEPEPEPGAADDREPLQETTCNEATSPSQPSEDSHVDQRGGHALGDHHSDEGDASDGATAPATQSIHGSDPILDGTPKPPTFVNSEEQATACVDGDACQPATAGKSANASGPNGHDDANKSAKPCEAAAPECEQPSGAECSSTTQATSAESDAAQRDDIKLENADSENGGVSPIDDADAMRPRLPEVESSNGGNAQLPNPDSELSHDTERDQSPATEVVAVPHNENAAVESQVRGKSPTEQPDDAGEADLPGASMDNENNTQASEQRTIATNDATATVTVDVPTSDGANTVSASHASAAGGEELRETENPDQGSPPPPPQDLNAGEGARSSESSTSPEVTPHGDSNAGRVTAPNATAYPSRDDAVAELADAAVANDGDAVEQRTDCMQERRETTETQTETVESHPGEAEKCPDKDEEGPDKAEKYPGRGQEAAVSAQEANSAMDASATRDSTDCDQVDGKCEASATDETQPAEEAEALECGICETEYALADFDGNYTLLDADFPAFLKCGHRFCTGCWLGHIEAVIDSSRASDCARLSCPEVDCGCPMTIDTVVDFLREKGHHSKADAYLRLLCQLFARLASPRWLRRCPSSSCSLVILAPMAASSSAINLLSHHASAEDDVAMEVTCSCGHRFCFHCGLGPHSPATCSDARKWVTLREQAGTGKHMRHEDAQWIRTNQTFFCPRCRMPGTRAAGCNHITCLCGHEFCIVCLGTWSEHDMSGGFFRCDVDNADAQRKAILKSLGLQDTLERAMVLPQDFGAFEKRFKQQQEAIEVLKQKKMALSEHCRLHRPQRSSKAAQKLQDPFAELLLCVCDDIIRFRNLIAWALVSAFHQQSEESAAMTALDKTAKPKKSASSDLLSNPIVRFEEKSATQELEEKQAENAKSLRGDGATWLDRHSFAMRRLCLVGAVQVAVADVERVTQCLSVLVQLFVDRSLARSRSIRRFFSDAKADVDGDERTAGSKHRGVQGASDGTWHLGTNPMWTQLSEAIVDGTWADGAELLLQLVDAALRAVTHVCSVTHSFQPAFQLELKQFGQSAQRAVESLSEHHATSSEQSTSPSNAASGNTTSTTAAPTAMRISWRCFLCNELNASRVCSLCGNIASSAESAPETSPAPGFEKNPGHALFAKLALSTVHPKSDDSKSRTERLTAEAKRLRALLTKVRDLQPNVHLEQRMRALSQGSDPGQRDQGAQDNVAAGIDATGGWYCGVCTFHNTPSSSRCEICGQGMRPNAGRQPRGGGRFRN